MSTQSLSVTDFSNLHTLKLFWNNYQKNGSSVVSGFSSFIISLMTYMGTSGRTRDQMNKLLGITQEDCKYLVPEIIKLMENVNYHHEDKGTTRVINSIFADKTYPFLESYMELVKQFGMILPTDFKNNPDDAQKAINELVGKNTEGKIMNLIPDNIITSDTRLVLINTIYFKSLWKNPFEKWNTKRKPFTVLSGEEKEVDMMSISERFPYTEDNKFQYLEMPFNDYKTMFGVILPKNGVNMEMIQNFNHIDHLKYSPVVTYLPKYKQRSKINIKNNFMDMGVTDLFTNGSCDLKNMTDENNLYVSDALQEVVVEVEEGGVEAAGATAMVFALETCIDMPQGRPIVFNADHSFFYYIRDRRNGAIMFYGLYNGE